jgi:hypothetical protein
MWEYHGSTHQLSISQEKGFIVENHLMMTDGMNVHLESIFFITREEAENYDL